MSTFLVTGARGKTGREVVRQLAAEQDIEVRAGSAQPSQLNLSAPSLPVLFDWNDESTWPAAVAGVDAIYLMRPDLEDAAAMASRLIRLSPDSHVVLLSEQGSELVPDDDWVALVEMAVAETARRWTILRPSWFHQDLTDERLFLNQIRGQREIGMPTAGASIAWVDTRDVAAVAVKALLDPDAHLGRHYTLTGPQSLTMQDVSSLLSAESGEAITAVDQPLSEALAGMEGWIAEVLGSLYGRVQNGTFGALTDTVESITGVAPRSLGDFIREHRSEWVPPDRD